MLRQHRNGRHHDELRLKQMRRTARAVTGRSEYPLEIAQRVHRNVDVLSVVLPYTQHTRQADANIRQESILELLRSQLRCTLFSAEQSGNSTRWKQRRCIFVTVFSQALQRRQLSRCTLRLGTLQLLQLELQRCRRRSVLGV